MNGGRQTWIAGVPLFLGFFLMPILFALAVLRYRLYDLDVIISRAVLVVVGTAFAAVGYTALVVLAGQQVEGRSGGFWVSLLATSLSRSRSSRCAAWRSGSPTARPTESAHNPMRP